MHSISKSAQALLNQVHGGTDLGEGPDPAQRPAWVKKHNWKMLQKSGRGVGFTTVIVVQHSDEKTLC